ncbi:hypothetical protein MYIN104542_30460 [Mycobacterium intermedium]
MQVQQRQHLADLRGLARPGRQDRRRKPLSLTRIGINPFVVHPRRGDLDRTSGGQHVAGLVVPVAHHQPASVLVELVSELVDIRGDLGGQRRGQHLPGTIANNLIQQRPASASVTAVG